MIAKIWRGYLHPPRDTGDSGWYVTKTQQNKLIRSESPHLDSRRRAHSLRVVR